MRRLGNFSTVNSFGMAPAIVFTIVASKNDRGNRSGSALRQPADMDASESPRRWRQDVAAALYR